ncbi:MAG: helix-turn-helix transcriptional regulator [bacterium]|nr:helix-turn-helix transcriptional regulator [bacterium]
MNTKILSNFGEQIRNLRKDLNISQEELAEKLGIHRTYMSFIERGLRNPSLLMVYKISRALKVKLPSLFEFDK